jgi:hypothetical protein
MTLALVVIVSLVLTQTVSVYALHLSIIVHNAGIPIQGAQVTYTITKQGYQYAFHKFITQHDRLISLTLPAQFHEGDMTTLLRETFPYDYIQPSEDSPLGSGGTEVWFTLTPLKVWELQAQSRAI